MIRRALSALAWIALGAALGGVLLLFLGLFWASVVLLVYAAVLLVYAAGAWLIARCWPAGALAAMKLGDMAPGLPEPRGWPADEEQPVAATPPTFLLREQYPKDGC